MSDTKIIFSMVGVGKIHKPNKQVLKDIYLSFFYGAKIGVLGLNGAGKSTLLRIIAGIDKEYIGEITSQKGITFGYLPQEPQLDAAKTVKEIVEEGVHEVVALIKDTKPSRRNSANQTRTSTSFSRSRETFRTRSSISTHGTSTASSSRRWTRCAALPAIRR